MWSSKGGVNSVGCWSLFLVWPAHPFYKLSNLGSFKALLTFVLFWQQSSPLCLLAAWSFYSSAEKSCFPDKRRQRAMTSRSEDGGLADDDQLRVDLCSFQTLLFFRVSFVNPLERGLVLRTPWEGQIEEDRNAAIATSISNRNLFFQLILTIYVWLFLWDEKTWMKD